MTAFVSPALPWPTVPGVDYGRSATWFLRTVTLSMPDGSTFTQTIFDLDPTQPLADGRQCLAEAIARRLVTTRGTLIDDPEYGTNLTDYLNDDIDPRTAGRIGAQAEAEAMKDERVINAAAAVTFARRVLTIGLTLFDGRGPFKLVVSISDALFAVQVL